MPVLCGCTRTRIRMQRKSLVRGRALCVQLKIPGRDTSFCPCELGDSCCKPAPQKRSRRQPKRHTAQARERLTPSVRDPRTASANSTLNCANANLNGPTRWPRGCHESSRFPKLLKYPQLALFHHRGNLAAVSATAGAPVRALPTLCGLEQILAMARCVNGDGHEPLLDNWCWRGIVL